MARAPLARLKSLLLPLGVIGVLGAAFLWLSTNAETTINKRQLSVPRVRVALEVRPEIVPAIPSPADAQDAESRETAAPAISSLALSPAPMSELTENGPFGLLPAVSPDGRKPWEVYSHAARMPVNQPRLSIVITGLGLRTSLTEEAMAQLPPAVTLAFSPYGQSLQSQMDAVRAQGYETLLDLPLESINSGEVNQGPYELRINISLADNLDRLKWVLSRAHGYIGLVNLRGDKFVRHDQELKPVLQQLADRGLLFIDNDAFSTNQTANLATQLRLDLLSLNRKIDEPLTVAGIEQHLAEVLRNAPNRPYQVIYAEASPLILKTLHDWLKSDRVKQNMALVPLSDLARNRYQPSAEPVAEPAT